MLRTIQNRSFGIKGIFRLSWNLFKLNWPLLAYLSCLYMPINLIRTLIPVEYVTERYGNDILQLSVQALNFIDFLISIAVTSGVIYIVEKSVHGEKIFLSDVFKFGVSRWWSVLKTSLLSYLIRLGWTLLLIIPGIIWSNYYVFAFFAATVRDISGKSALDYSKRLVEGQWWRVFWVLLVICAFIFIIAAPSLIVFRFKVLPDVRFIRVFLPWIVTDFIRVIDAILLSVFFLHLDYQKNPAINNTIVPI